MSFFSWLQNLCSDNSFGESKTPRLRSARRRPGRSHRLQFESLEGRVVLAAAVVTTSLDVVDDRDGFVSLREAIGAARDGDQISFDTSLSGSTIKLDLGELLINKDLDILGPGANDLAISGNGKSRVFEISAGTRSS